MDLNHGMGNCSRFLRMVIFVAITFGAFCLPLLFFLIKYGGSLGDIATWFAVEAAFLLFPAAFLLSSRSMLRFKNGVPVRNSFSILKSVFLGLLVFGAFTVFIYGDVLPFLRGITD